MSYVAPSSRFGRQYGLVRQDRIENLNVLVLGDSDILPYLLLNLSLLGVGALQGGVYLDQHDPTVSERHIFGQFLLREEDIGRNTVEAYSDRLGHLYPLFDLQQWPAEGPASIVPDVTVLLPTAEKPLSVDSNKHGCSLFGQLGSTSVYIGHDPVEVENFHRSILTPSLASIAGSILAQDILRLSNSLRGIPILDQSIELSLRIRSTAARDYFKLSTIEQSQRDIPFTGRLKLGNEHLRTVDLLTTEEFGEGVLRLELPRDSYLSRLILDSVEVVEEPLDKKSGFLEPLFFSLLDDDVLEDRCIKCGSKKLPSELCRLKPVIVGIGGLGTWVAALLSSTNIQSLELVIVDSDSLIEEHNLNRQVLYSVTDLGRPKADAAADALQAINPDCQIHHYPLHLKEDLALYLDQGLEAEYSDPDSQSPDGEEGHAGVDLESLLSSMLTADLNTADVIASCLDNMQTRWILNILAQQARIPMVNGGVIGFIGSADYIDMEAGDASMTSRYGEGIKTDTEKIQCGGSIPIPSIVTTNAFIGSIQSAFSILCALGLKPTHNYLYFDGTSRHLHQLDFEEEDPDSLGVNAVLEELRTHYGIEE